MTPCGAPWASRLGSACSTLICFLHLGAALASSSHLQPTPGSREPGQNPAAAPARRNRHPLGEGGGSFAPAPARQVWRELSQEVAGPGEQSGRRATHLSAALPPTASEGRVAPPPNSRPSAVGTFLKGPGARPAAVSPARSLPHTGLESCASDSHPPRRPPSLFTSIFSPMQVAIFPGPGCYSPD